MKRKSIKNKILLLFSFLFILISTLTISSFAYHDDDNGNLVSDNLYNIGSYTGSSSGVSMNVSNQTLTLNGKSSGGIWNNRPELSITLEAGTYTMQWFTNYTSNNIGFGLRNSSSGLSELYQLNTQRYRTFTINESTTFTTVIWVGSSGLTFDNVKISCMVYSGNYKAFTTFEPYGQVFYSHDTLNKISRYNYGPFSYATNIQLTYNNGSSSFVYKNYSNIYDLTLETFIGFSNQCIVVDDYKFIFSNLGGNANWTYTFNFTFVNNSIKVSDFNEWYFYGPISYSFISGSTNFSNSSSGNPDIIILTDHNFSSSAYITNFSFTRKNPYYGGLSSTKVGTPNSSLGYDNGYINGFDDARDQVTESYSTIIKKYEDTIKTLSDRVSYLENANRNYTNLLWTIGATPWESFKHIWNVEFGGINIASIVTGLVTALLVIYLIKKVWK